MVCSRKLVLLAACLLIAATSAQAAALTVGSGKTLTFITGPTAKSANPYWQIATGGVVDSNGYGSINNGTALFEFDTVDIQTGSMVTFGTTATPYPIHIKTSGNISIDAVVDVNGPGNVDAQGGINVAGGYRGGAKCTNAYVPAPDTTANGKGFGPGGGGSGSAAVSGGSSRAGGGAAYGGNGGVNGYAYGGSTTSPNWGSYAAVAYGTPQIFQLIGGSGGGGGKDGSSGSGTGGGAIGLTSTGGSITIGSSGKLLAMGGDGLQPAVGTTLRYRGGGGSGGSIRLDAGTGTVTINGLVSAKGGHGGSATYSPDAAASLGGGGGGGRVAIYTSTSPAAYLGTGSVDVAGGDGGHFIPRGASTTSGGPGIAGSIYYATGALPKIAVNPSPVDAATGVSVFTNLAWTSVGGALQEIYFGTSAGSMTLLKSDSTGALQTITSSEIKTFLGGVFPADMSTYYWKVVTDGAVSAATTWSFTTDAARAHDPNVPNDTLDVPQAGRMLYWNVDETATSFDVYFGTDATAVANRTTSKLTTGSGKSGSYDTLALSPGTFYYWVVDTTYPSGNLPGTVWHFRSVARQISLNTGVTPPTYSIEGGASGTGLVNDANIAVYKFATFSYDSTWDIKVSGNRGVDLQSDGDIVFNGVVDLTGMAGGWKGEGTKVQNDPQTEPNKVGPGHGLHNTDNAVVVGGGAGYGGAGGNGGRSFVVGSTTYYTGGSTYGTPDLFEMIGGSGGGGGGGAAGATGGGVLQFYAKGNLSIGALARVIANGGSAPTVAISVGGGSGAGSGGSIRLVSAGNVTIAGAVSANGGRGGSVTDSADARNAGGGGGGGRIAVYYGGTSNLTGSSIAAAGGQPGIIVNTGGTSAAAGSAGTTYTGATAVLTATHGNVPATGAYMNLADPNFAQVSWYPAIGSTENKLYLGTSLASMTLQNTYTNAGGLMAQKVFKAPSMTNGNRYYWRVDYTIGTTTYTGPTWMFYGGACTSAPTADLNGDCKVDSRDLGLMCQSWLSCQILPATDCF